MKNKYVFEVCLDSVESALAAQEGGADRVELCDNLFEGGTTPSAGAIRLARAKLSIGLQVIIRPRGGDFCYSDIEMEVMKQDVITAREAGADGVVIGILLPDGRVDKARCAELIELAGDMNVTFHRAFDMTRDPYEALEDIISLGCSRILTSGQEATVPEGLDLLKKLVQKAGDRIIIMPGNGITERNMDKVIRETGASEYHVYLHGSQPSRMEFRPDHIYMGGLLRQPEFANMYTDRSRMNTIRRIGQQF